MTRQLDATVPALLVYVASLPVLWPSLFSVDGKVVVPGDAAFAALVLALAAGRFTRLRPPHWPLIALAGLPVIAVAVTARATGVPGLGRLELFRVGYSMAVLVVLGHLRLSETERLAVCRTWLGAAAVVSALGLVGFAVVRFAGAPANPLAHPYSSTLRETVRVAATLGPNTLPIYGLTAVTLAAVLLGHRGRAVWSHGIVWLATGTVVVASLLTYSRGLIWIVLALAILGHLGLDRMRLLWRGRWVLTGAAVALVVAGLAATLWAIFPVEGRLDEERRQLQLTLSTRPSEYWLIHVGGVRMFLAHPFVGVGPGEFGRSFLRFTTPGERSESPFARSGANFDPHSTWLGLAATTGLLGLGSWLALYGWILARLLRARPGGDPFGLPQAVGIGAVGLLLNGLHVEISHLKFVWAFLGLGLAAERSWGSGDGDTSRVLQDPSRPDAGATPPGT